ncbi:MAG TPA: hypothetical protein VI078_17635 [bacterium]
MRRARAAAAAALAFALALAAGGCKPTTTTPLGVGTRGPDTGAGTYSGAWASVSASGVIMTFAVSGGDVAGLVFNFPEPCLGVDFEDIRLPIENAAFSFDGGYKLGGNVVVEGTFTSPDSAIVSLSFSGFPVVHGCSTSGRETFTASKVPLP